MTEYNGDDQIEVFLQGEGIRDIVLARVPRMGTVQDVIAIARDHGLSAPADAEVVVWVEDAEEPLPRGATLDAVGIGHRSRVHVHQCRRVAVTVNYNGDHKAASFSPATTVGRVKQWAVGKQGFGLTPIDAAEHLLQVCSSTTRPDEDVHIGALVQAPNCGLCFDLIAKKRVEG